MAYSRSFPAQKLSCHSRLPGRSLGDEPEYHVEKDPRTPPVARDENPPHHGTSPAGLGVSGGGSFNCSHNRYYSVNTAGLLARWNRTPSRCCTCCFK